jgi:ribosomal protein L24
VHLKDIKKGAEVSIAAGPYRGSYGKVVRYDNDLVLIEFPDTRNKPSRVKVLPDWLELKETP